MRKYLYALAVVGTVPFILGNANTGGCEGQSTTAHTEQQKTEANQRRLNAASPIPRVDRSLERENLIERAKVLNAQNGTGCITLLAPSGAKVAQSMVKRKVTSLNSYLTADSQIVDDPFGSIDAGGQIVEQPDVDGTYGKNVDGVFWFNAETGAYEEWNGLYFFSTQCSRIGAEPVIIRTTTK